VERGWVSVVLGMVTKLAVGMSSLLARWGQGQCAGKAWVSEVVGATVKGRMVEGVAPGRVEAWVGVVTGRGRRAK
jgi:hypothetical protein